MGVQQSANKGSKAGGLTRGAKSQSAGTGATQAALPKAPAWLNLVAKSAKGVEYKIKRGVPMNPEEDPVFAALIESEKRFRDQCIANGVEYVPRTIQITGQVQLVDEPKPVPDLFEV